jgi:hypothetical protein
MATVVVSLASAPLAGQAPPARPAKLLGIVRTEDKQPVAGADIQIVSGPGTSSNERGFFRLDSITPGERKLIIRKVGYAPLEITWPFAAGDSIVRIFEMSSIQTLDSVVTVDKRSRDSRMEEFEEHRKLGLGKFYTRADIEKSGGRISNLLAGTGGIKLTNGPANQAYVQSSRGSKSLGRGTCYAEVYLDDMNIYTKRTSGSPPPFDVNSIPSSEIEAIEYYAGAAETPAKYTKLGTSCGVLVIHTRRQ